MRTNKFLKATGIILGSCLLTAAVVGLAMPSILSTSWGQRTASSYINHQIPGNIQFSDWKISWFGKQKVNNLLLKDENGETIVTLRELETDSSLVDLLVFKKLDGKTLINDLNAHIVQDGLGATNVEKALGVHDKNPTRSYQNPINIDLKGVNGNIQLEPLTLHLTGKTAQNGAEGHFDIDAALKGISVAELKNLTSEQLLAKGDLEAKANIANLPVALIDQVLSAIDPKFANLAKNALGDKLDLVVNQTINNGSIAFQINAASPNLTADLLGTVDKGIFKLKQPGNISLKINPDFFAQIAEMNRIKGLIQLKQPTTLRAAVESISLPIDPAQWKEAGLVAKIDLPETYLKTLLPLGEFMINSANATIEAPTTSKNMSLVLTSTATQRGKPVAIQAFASFEKPESLAEFVQSLRQNSKVNVSINGIPLMFVEQAFGLGDALTSTLGQTAKLQFALAPNKNYADITAHLETDKLIVSDVHFTLNDNLKLLKTANVRYHLAADQANSLFLKDQPIKFQSDLPLDIKISKVHLPVKDFTPENVSVEGEIVIPNLTLLGDQKIGSIEIRNLKTILNGQSLADLHYFSVGDVETPSAYLKSIWGAHTNLHLNGNIRFDKDFKLHAIEARGNVQSELALAKFAAQIVDLNRLMITAPSTLTYTLTNEALTTLGMASKNATLTAPTPIQFQLDISNKPLVFDGLKGLNLNGLVHIDAMTLANEAEIRQLNIPWEIDANANLIRVDMSGLSKNGKLRGSFAIANWIQNNQLNFTYLQFNAKTAITDLPLSILETLTGSKELVTLFGPSIDLDLDAAYPAGNFEFTLRGQQIEANASLKMGDTIALKDTQKPATIWYTLTPERFKTMRKYLGVDVEKEGIVLDESSPIKITLGSLSLPKDFNLSKVGFTSALALDKLKIKDLKTQQMLAFENLHAHLNTPELANQIAFNLTGQQSFAAKSDFLFQGQLEKPFTKSGHLNTQDMTLNLKSKLATFPAGLVCSIFCTESTLRPKIEALFGQTIDADMQIQLQKMNGPIVGQLGGKNGTIQIDGKINNGYLTLNNTFQAQFALTPELGKSVLEEYIPLLSGLIGSDNPLTFTIEPNGFSMPITNFDKNAIQIGQGAITLGRVNFRNDGKLGQVMSLLNNSRNDDISVWFTPLYFRMAKGNLSLERMDLLLLNMYPIATWGTVDLARDKVNIIIGLTGNALTRAFHLEGLDNAYMMQIPFRGTLKDASIDKRAATAKISALVASTRGPQGQIIGTFLDIAGGALTDEKVPNPTTNPLPWDYQGEVPTDKKISENEKPKKHKDDAAKGFEKEAKKMFKNIFK